MDNHHVLVIIISIYRWENWSFWSLRTWFYLGRVSITQLPDSGAWAWVMVALCPSLESKALLSSWQGPPTCRPQACHCWGQVLYLLLLWGGSLMLQVLCLTYFLSAVEWGVISKPGFQSPPGRLNHAQNVKSSWWPSADDWSKIKGQRDLEMLLAHFRKAGWCYGLIETQYQSRASPGPDKQILRQQNGIKTVLNVFKGTPPQVDKILMIQSV